MNAKGSKKDKPKHHQHHQLDALGRKIKKKISWFYKIHFSLFLLASIILFYFLVLTSVEPKSIPLITERIEFSLREKFGNDVGLSNSAVSFTRYGTLKISINTLTILYAQAENEQKQAFIIPRLETEFSLLNLLLMRFHPTKVKVINPTIIINNAVQDEQLAAGKEDNVNHAVLIIGLLSSIREGQVPIKNFEIENAKLLIRRSGVSDEFIIRKSQIRTFTQDKIFHISSINQIGFSNQDEVEKSDVAFSSDCQLFKHHRAKCDLFLENFSTNSISNLHPNLSLLGKINATLNATASFDIKDKKMGNLFFKAEAKKGDFDFSEFFNQPISFDSFSIAGDYDDNLGILNLSDVKVDFAKEAVLLQGEESNVPTAHLDMSLMISDLKNEQNKKLDFLIKVQDIPTDELEKYWPSALNQGDVRKWVLEHVEGGIIKNAYAKFSIAKTVEGNQLESMDSKVVFNNLNLKYGEDFPEITALDGVANFSKKAMQISLNSGDVLNSKISNGLVAIDDFDAPTLMLRISGKSQGHAADGLKHANNEKLFAKELEKYLNGNSQNNFDIRIPLNSQIDLKDCYIGVNSAITALNSDYVKGDVTINSTKNFGSHDFVSYINLTSAALVAKAFDVEKEVGIESGLSFNVSLKNPHKINLQNISLWKKEGQKVVDVQKIKSSEISGEIELELAPFMVSSINLKNDNFGKNDYSFSYKADAKNSSQKVFLKAQQLNLASFIENNFLAAPKESGGFKNLSIKASANNINLAHNKSLRNFSLSLNCANDLCDSGVLKGNYGKKQFINLVTAKNPKEDFVATNGRITDVGYLAEGLGISNVISAGDADVKLQNKIIDSKSVLKGKVEINNSITIYDSPSVKKLAKNNLFSKVRDKIFSNDKTIFDSVKLEFEMQDAILNIKSLVANNYKIGITAKGEVDLKKDTYAIKGMIVPGFIVNNLFGIGKIPLIGGVISGLLTGGEGGGLFGIHYEYVKKAGDKEAKFDTNKVAAFVPSTIQNLFE